MIEDKELREIFKIESGEHIQRLEESFLRLEKEPQNAAVLEEAFREAHSLKGAARMLGLTGIESISHRLEDILGTGRKSPLPMSSAVIDQLYKGLDAIRNLIKEAIMGEQSGVDVSLELSQWKLISGKHPASAESGIYTQKSGITEPASADFRIDTVRVETNRLDKLMSLTGELNVTKIRIRQRVSDIINTIMFCEEITKELSAFGIRSTELKNKNSAIQNLKSKMEKLNLTLNTFKNAIYEDSSRLDFTGAELEDSVSRIRLLPLSTIFNFFQRMVRDLAKELTKEVRLTVEGGETAADKRIIEEMRDPLMHMVRNTLDHGIELPEERERKNKPRMGTITLKAYQTPSNIVIEVSDDGQGLNLEAISKAALKRKIINESDLAAMSQSQICSLIFNSGVSTSAIVSDVSGRGVGLNVVRANVERLKGAIAVESIPEKGCSFRIQLPLTLATSRVMLVSVDNRKYAVPLEHIQTTCNVNRNNIFTMEGRRAIVFNNLPVPIACLADLLELQDDKTLSLCHNFKTVIIPCVILSIGDDRLGILVDELLDEQEIVLKQAGKILKRVRNTSGSTILGTGEVCLVLNPYDLIRSARKKEALSMPSQSIQETEDRKSILVAEDSISVRTQMKRILEGAGYEVAVAVDGLDAYAKLGDGSFDALVSDIIMPNMSGLELTEKIRQNKKYRELPIILVTSLASAEDKQKGLEAGANAYLIKPTFDQRGFLEILGRLI